MKLIALEEAFTIPELNDKYPQIHNTGAVKFSAEFARRIDERIADFEKYRLPEMDEFGVDMHVLSMTVPGIQANLSPEDAIDAARFANDYLADVVQRHPDRFAGFAALPMQDPDAAVAELRRAVGDLGMCGVLVNDHTQGVYLDDPRYESFWSALEEVDRPIYIHPGAPVLDRWTVLDGAPELPGATWSWATEAGGHGLRLLFAGVFDRHPKAKVILGHMGEFLPYMRSRLDSRYATLDTGRHIERKPSEYIGENILITISGVPSSGALVGSILEVGADAILFAIDYPYEFTEDAVSAFEVAALSDLDRAKIGYLNAQKLLKLPTTKLSAH